MREFVVKIQHKTNTRPFYIVTHAESEVCARKKMIDMFPYAQKINVEILKKENRD